MKVFRFMSEEEFNKFNKGETLKNNKDHSKSSKSNSIGFCFFSLDDVIPEEAMHFLSGIVSFDICALFDVDEKLLNKTHARYAKDAPQTGDLFVDLLMIFTDNIEFEIRDEYCTTEYNNKTFKLEKWTTNCWNQWNPVKNKQSFDWNGGK